MEGGEGEGGGEERKKEKYTFEDKYVCAQARTCTSVKMFFAYETSPGSRDSINYAPLECR